MKNEQEILQYYAEELGKYKNSKICHFIGPNHPLVPIDDWKLCYDNGIDLASTDIYCESGKRTHDRVRESYNCRVVGIRPTYDNENEQHAHLHDGIGLKTPRKGFYKIISISEDGKMLNCYYNFKRGNAFLEEIVEINRKPFYNKASVGPKQDIIQVNDIIEVKDTDLVDIEYDGLPDKAYRIIWDFINHKNEPTEEYVEESFGSSYAQYGGYNDWDDDTINSAFEGDPEATWNID